MKESFVWQWKAVNSASYRMLPVGRLIKSRFLSFYGPILLHVKGHQSIPLFVRLVAFGWIREFQMKITLVLNLKTDLI